MQTWYCAATYPRHEKAARDRAIEIGLTALLPFTYKSRKRSLKIDRILEPLFPGYLFVCGDEESLNIDALRARYHVRGLLGIGGVGYPPYLPVPQEVMDALEARDVGGYVDTEGLTPGCRVEIVDPLSVWVGRSGLFQQDKAGRVSVLLDLIIGQTAVPVTLADVQRIYT